MSNIALKKQQINDRRKRQVVKNWLSSFVTTSVVLVSAVVINSTAPSANFLNLSSVGTSVYYQVEIIDESLSLYENSIKIVAECSLDKQEQVANLGINDGVFYDLKPNMQYTISIVGNTGYGEYALQKKTIKTTKNYAGELIEAIFAIGEYETLNCEVKGIYNDYKNLISELKVQYTYYIIDEQWQENESVDQTIEEQFFTVQIFNLPRINGYLQISLIATLNTEEVVTLDQKTFYTPYLVNAYAYAYMIEENVVEAVVYPDAHLQNATYFAVLKQNGQVVEQKNVTLSLMSEYEENYYIGQVAFYNILINNEYTLEFYVKYTNEHTNKEVTTLFKTENVVTYVMS